MAQEMTMVYGISGITKNCYQFYKGTDITEVVKLKK